MQIFSCKTKQAHWTQVQYVGFKQEKMPALWRYHHHHHMVFLEWPKQQRHH